MKPLVYIETLGCQMNERDSEIMAQLLADQFSPANNLENADLVVVNTCSIRGKAEQKAFSLLGRLRKLKEKKPDMLVAVAGCVAQQEGEKIRKRMPHVDIVVGPQEIYQLPALLQKAANNIPSIAISMDKNFHIPAFLPDMRHGSSHKRFVTIMQGCNNYCTYCVVPYTRGQEISRKFDDIIEEIKHLASHGIKEITLIGQNVNSYGKDFDDTHTFTDLLRAVNSINGIQRIRFTTSHPKDLSEDLMRCFKELPALCPHIHLPVQSGSNSILQRMNRKYTIESYLDKVEKLRSYRPDIVISTDIIVGFPGETEEDFQATMDLFEKVRYHSAYSFKYSDRPHARSTAFEGKLDEQEKSRRLEILQSRQEAITMERLEEFVGKEMEIMVEGVSRAAGGQISGRTRTNHIVNFTSSEKVQEGDILLVHIDKACLHSLRGTPARMVA